MAFFAVGLAYGMTTIDQHYGAAVIEQIPGLRTTGQAARSSLGALAGALVTVVGVVISITVVSLTVTASQFGSRILRIVLGDRVTHLTLGGLLASALYCLLVLFAVREDESIYTPHLSVALAIVLGVVSLGALIYYTHNIGVKIQAPLVISSVAQDLEMAINRIFPMSLGDPAEAKEVREQEEKLGGPDGEPNFLVRAEHQGYIQGIDSDSLFDLANNSKVVVQLLRRPGDFTIKGSPIAAVWREEDDNLDLSDAIQGAFYVGPIRLPVDDVEYAFNELVEIAIRALSPGLNDTFTAITCIQWICAGLSSVAKRRPPSRYRCDDRSTVRLIADAASFEELIRSALDPIRAAGKGNVQIASQLMHGLLSMAQFARSRAHADAVWERAKLLHEETQAAGVADIDRIDIDAYFQEIAASFEQRFDEFNSDV